MSRVVSFCLCALVAFTALTGVRLLSPAAVLAASGTLSMETPLHDSPSHGAPVIALLPEGTVVSIDGPPVDGFYPVSTEGLSGWMRGETLQLEKDVAFEGEAVPAATEEATTGAMVPVEQTAGEQPAPVQDQTAPADSQPASDTQVAPEAAPTLATAPPETPPAEPAPATNAPIPATDGSAPPADAATNPVDTAAPPADPSSTAPPVATAAPEPAPAALTAATPVPGDAAVEAPVEAPTESAASAAPSVTPLPQPELSPTGPASVVVDAPIRVGPGEGFDLIFTVPNGSTLQQTGHVVDGYVTVQYKEVTGWAAREHLGQPSQFVAETPAPEATEPIDVKTPRPGSGVAFTTIDMSMRTAPSADAEPVAIVPAGSRVVLTGVMEGNFQRVTYQDEIGWVSNDYLSTPENPEPESSGNQQNYSRRDIVNIINDAADEYDQSRSDMLRVAQCESNLDPYAVNPSGSYGLFQFIRSTWKSTPFGDQDIFDPQANANAAAWMWSEGRKSEWVCQ